MELHPDTVLLKKLREQFHVFDEFKPLRIGIHDDLATRQIAPMEILVNALAGQTRDRRYLRQVAAGEVRYDLDCRESGTVSLNEQRYAAARLGLKISLPDTDNDKPARTSAEELAMQANTIKVSTTTTGFERNLHVNSIGDSSVPIAVQWEELEMVTTSVKFA